jgi:ankyrin repeat protein
MFILYIIVIILTIQHITDEQDGCTALHKAVINGHYDCCQLLIQARADVDIKDNVSALVIQITYRNNSLITM